MSDRQCSKCRNASLDSHVFENQAVRDLDLLLKGVRFFKRNPSCKK